MAKPSKASSSSSSSSRQHAPTVSDPRFTRLQTDPRFLRPQKEASKVIVDDRFRGLLDGKDFGINQDGEKGRKIDRFGRKKGKGTKEEEKMKRLYRLEEKRAGAASESEEDQEEEEEEASDDDDGDGDGDGDGEGGYIDYARGAANLESSSDEDSESSDEDEEESSEEEEEDVAIGSYNLLRKDRRRRETREYDDSESDSAEEEEQGVSSVDPKILAQLDAEAAAAIRQGAAEDSSEEEEEEIAVSSSKAAAKQHRKKRESRVPMGEETHRLAIVNLDWDHVRSLDLYKIFSSLVSPLATRLPGTANFNEDGEDKGRVRRKQASLQVKGTVELVRIYPSEFGQERMKREDIEGPPKDIFKSGQDPSSSSTKKKRSSKGKGKGKRRDVDEDSDDDSDVVFEVDDGGEFDEEALRKYQLDRLRYYYAVATFDSTAAARHVYDEIDGTEMERTANVFDLRFVPEEMTFPDHPNTEGEDGWRDEAKPGIDDTVSYKGVDWATDALRHSKVRLTWDAPDPERQKVIRRAMTKDDLRDDDFKAYLASDTDTDDGDDHQDDEALPSKSGKGAAGRDRFRALLGVDDAANVSGSAFSSKKKKHASSAFQDGRASDDDDSEMQGDMEITFLPGLSEAAAARKAKSGEGKEDGEETTLEKYLRKQREKKERKRAAREGGREEEGEEGGRTQAVITSGTTAKENELGFDDPFFASGGEEEEHVDLDATLAQENKKRALKGKDKVSKEGKTKSKSKDDGKTQASPDELALLIDDDESQAVGGREHFDMKDILKSESKSGKKLNRWERKKAKKAGLDLPPTSSSSSSALVDGKAGRKGVGQKDFTVDVHDSRFGELMSNHEYALDPTHPSFLKTENMKRLMEERRRRSVKEGGGGGGGEEKESVGVDTSSSKKGGMKRKGQMLDDDDAGGGAGDGGTRDGNPAELLRDLKRRQVGQDGFGKKKQKQKKKQ